ncbi:unnamed protein product [Protopolystoma xenopodis]|uniref:Uncharacterized protein n=1 Tax=Protopolystoma xenopodis TaxID=117903 RepID=A0A448XIN6_9PLAT|nr:unnamed protein product [Protopolystoma xenopodis]
MLALLHSHTRPQQLDRWHHNTPQQPSTQPTWPRPALSIYPGQVSRAEQTDRSAELSRRNRQCLKTWLKDDDSSEPNAVNTVMVLSAAVFSGLARCHGGGSSHRSASKFCTGQDMAKSTF